MSILGVLGVLLIIALIGFLVWLLETKVTMSRTFKVLLELVAAGFIIWWVGNITGLWAWLGSQKV